MAQWDGSTSGQVTTDRKVGIGTGNPSAKLEIGGTSSVSPILVVNNTFAAYSGNPLENRPFVVRRNTSDAESISSYIQDRRVYHYYRNDENSSGMVFLFENTDTETGGGANASSNTPLFLYSDASRSGIGVNTSYIPSGYHLAVDGKAIMEEIKVQVSGNWPDYVFEEDYDLRSLEETQQYIIENKHLPEIPSAEEVEENGVNLGEMNALLLKKIEELTLHMIELKQENAQMNERLKVLEK